MNDKAFEYKALYRISDLAETVALLLPSLFGSLGVVGDRIDFICLGHVSSDEFQDVIGSFVPARVIQFDFAATMMTVPVHEVAPAFEKFSTRIRLCQFAFGPI